MDEIETVKLGIEIRIVRNVLGCSKYFTNFLTRTFRTGLDIKA